MLYRRFFIFVYFLSAPSALFADYSLGRVCSLVLTQAGIQLGQIQDEERRAISAQIVPIIRKVETGKKVFLESGEFNEPVDREMAWQAERLVRVMRQWREENNRLQRNDHFAHELPSLVASSTVVIPNFKLIVNSKIEKALDRHPQIKSRFEIFSQFLEEDPFGEDISSMKNFQKSKETQQQRNAGRVHNGSGARPWVHYHAHLKSGHPTMVVGWWVNQHTKEIEIDFLGTHEEANHHL